MVPSWFSSSFGTPSTCVTGGATSQTQQQGAAAGSTELLAASSSYSLAGVSQQQQQQPVVADVCTGNAVLADVLVDCLPPYYWEAKHMPRLVKVSPY